MRRALIVLAVMLVLLTAWLGASTHFTVSMGELNAADHELADGYFAIAQETAVMVKPGSSGWLVLRELRGKKVTLLVRVDD